MCTVFSKVQKAGVFLLVLLVDLPTGHGAGNWIDVTFISFPLTSQVILQGK